MASCPGELERSYSLSAHEITQTVVPRAQGENSLGRRKTLLRRSKGGQEPAFQVKV